MPEAQGEEGNSHLLSAYYVFGITHNSPSSYYYLPPYPDEDTEAQFFFSCWLPGKH